MSCILVFQDRPGQSGEKLAGFLRADFGEVEACSEDISSLKERLCAGKVSALVVLAQKALTPALEDFLGSNRNHVNLHGAPILVAHAKLEAPEAQRSLLLGATYVIEEPVDSELFVDLLRAELGVGPSRPKPHVEALQAPMRCLADAYGRIGRIEKSPAGNLLVETSLDLRPGERIELHHRIASDLRQEKLFYRVAEKTEKGLYYRFAFGYRLEWLRNEEHAHAFEEWVKTDHVHFSVPKIKVLFVLSDRAAPPSLSTELFSAYRITPGLISSALLSRLEPQVIVRSALPAEAERLLQDWLAQEGKGATIVLDEIPLEERNPAGEEAWRYRLMEKLEPFVRANFQATTEKYYFLNRGSPYSHFAVSTDAEILGLAWRHMRLKSHLNFAPGCLLQLHLPFQGEGADPIFVRVEERREALGGGFEFLCLICYLSADQRRRLVTGDARAHPVPRPFEGESYPEAEGRLVFLQGSPTRGVVLLALVGLLLLAFGGALWRYLKVPVEGAESGSQADAQGLSSYERFGKSVQKSLRLEKRQTKPGGTGTATGTEPGAAESP